MKKLAIYDPAMCCSTGVCGTDIDPALVQIASFLVSLDKEKFEVSRFNLAQEPQAYASNKEVARLMQEEGVEVLPLMFIDDKLAFSKEYPSIAALQKALGMNVLSFG